MALGRADLPYRAPELARLVSAPPREVERAMEELDVQGLAIVSGGGVVFPDMEADLARRAADQAEAGVQAARLARRRALAAERTRRWRNAHSDADGDVTVTRHGDVDNGVTLPSQPPQVADFTPVAAELAAAAPEIEPGKRVSLHPSQIYLFNTLGVFDITGKTPEELLRKAVSALTQEAYENASTFHRGVEGALRSLGCDVQREWTVPHRDGRTGRIDLVVLAPVRFAIELDNKISRGGSLKKLAQFDGERFIVLRHGPRILRPEEAISDKCVIPEWVPRQQWDEFVAMRVRIGHPMTEAAKGIAVTRLEKLVAEGNDAVAVLQESTFNGWRGLFEIKREQKNGQIGRSFAQERQQRNRDAAAASLGVGAGSHGHAGPGGGAVGGRDDGDPVRRVQAAAGGGAGE